MVKNFLRVWLLIILLWFDFGGFLREIRTWLVFNDHSHLLRLSLSFVWKRFKGGVFLWATVAWLRIASYAVTWRIRINLLLILVNNTRRKHLKAHAEILSKQHLRRCFYRFFLFPHKRIRHKQLVVILIKRVKQIQPNRHLKLLFNQVIHIRFYPLYKWTRPDDSRKF